MSMQYLYNQYIASSGVSTDSRSVSGNQIFFALHGENFDGNDYVDVTIAKGARLAVVDNPSVVNDKCLLVKDTLKELQALATYHRKRLGAKVLAITGTNGKTTTKELTSAVLSKKYKVHATKGNLNNSIGVPLTILSAPFDTEIMIVEMGASHRGDIDELCNVALPDMGIITNIGTAHIQGFGSYDGVVATKTELYRFLGNEYSTSFEDKISQGTDGMNIHRGTILFNDEDPVLSAQVKKVNVNAVPLSSPLGYVVDINVVPGNLTLDLQATLCDESYCIKTNLFGGYNINNIKTAVGIGLFFGVDMSDIKDAIESYKPTNNRSQLVKSGSNLLVCDAYNANPSSMRRAIDAFAELDADNKVVILGDMRELGNVSLYEHAAIIELLKEKHLGTVLLVGEEFGKVAVKSGYLSFPDVERAGEYLSGHHVSDSTILLKGSRGIGLERLFNVLS